MAITLYYFSNNEKKQRNERISVHMLPFVWFFLFVQSKNNAVLESRTGPFRKLVGFEAKAKDLKMCP